MKKITVKSIIFVMAIFVCILLASCSAKDPNHVHSFSDWNTVKKATCTDDGKEERACECGAKETRTIKATGHRFGDLTVTKKPTCTEKGEEERVCECGAKETFAIEASGHSIVKDEAVSATCETDGKTEGSHCSACGKITAEQKPIPAEHKWQEASCTAPKTCTVCKKTAGKALGHSMQGSECTRCGYTYKATLYEDSNVKFTFKKAEKTMYDENRVKLYFHVENKTRRTLVIQAEAVSLNGYCFEDLTMSSHVAPRVVGTVELTVDNFDFDSVDITNIECIGGQFRIVESDFKDYYNILFTNVALDGSGRHEMPDDFVGKNKLYEDSSCEIFYGFAEKTPHSSDRITVYMYVKNKSGKVLTFQADRLVINGTVFSNIVMSSPVLPQTVGLVIATIKQVDFNDVNIYDIKRFSGQLKVIDFETYKFYPAKIANNYIE